VIERLPSTEWIATARRCCDESGAVLIFDEIKTGFRLKPGGYQELAEVTPDLAVFGKAMTNGYPLAAVVGRESVMRAARDTWISSTLASETTALAACRAVLEWHARAEVCESLAEIGADMRGAVDRAIAASRVTGVRTSGLDAMWFIEFDAPERETRFLELAVGDGVLFKRGAYNFASLAHDEEAIAAIETAASSALVTLREEA
jgi:glutamate-1-semialdehyde aminotransferase